MTVKKKLKRILKKFTQSKVMEIFITSLLYAYLKFTAFTSKTEFQGVKEYYKFCDEKGANILISWHGRILLLPFSWRKGVKINALVSLHRDGMIIARILQKFKMNVIGGSTTKNGKTAAITLMKKMQDNESISIIPDGPRGPRMRLKMSPIYFAHKTGKPIFFATFNTSNKIVFNSWDKMILPLPFAKKAVVMLSEPYYVPKDANETDLENHRIEFEKIMNSLNNKADEYLGDEPIMPADKEKRTRSKTRKK